MRGTLTRAGTAGVVLLLLAVLGCQSQQAVLRPTAREPSAIQVEARGFSPLGDREHSTLELSLLFGDPKSVGDWKVEIVGAAGVQKTFGGSGKNLPLMLQWDGKTDRGDSAPEGFYRARLAVTYKDLGGAAFFTSRSFLLSASLPTARLLVAPPRLTPSGSGIESPIAILLTAHSPVARIEEWSLDILDLDGNVFRSFGGKWPAPVVEWDGTSTTGSFVEPERTYTAVARVRDEFGGTISLTACIPVDEVPAARSPNLVLPRSAGFSPSSETGARAIELFLGAADEGEIEWWKIAILHSREGLQKAFSGGPGTLSPGSKLDSWSLEIRDHAGNLTRIFGGKWPASPVSRDGSGARGEMVQSAAEYALLACVRDELGNVGEGRAKVDTDIMVEATPAGFRIQASRIYFKALSADYRDAPPSLVRQNSERLDALAEQLKKFPGYRIRSVGHAAMIHWDDPVLGKAEQEEILVPLSRARAEAVKQAIVDRRLNGFLFTTEGVGAADQLIPDSDAENRWKNRRVAFFLNRPGAPQEDPQTAVEDQ